MKHLIILFLFISSATFSQNYYPLDKAPDTTAPSNPINLTASNITQTTVILTWTAASDNVAVTNYRIYNNGAILVNTTGNVTNYLVTGLTADTLYDLTVRAIDAADNESNTSNSAVFSTNPSVVLDTQNPTAPINLTISDITENSVNLTWTASTDNVSVAGYYIYKVNNGVSILATVGVVNTYTLTGLTDSTPYSILIRAFDAAGNQSSNSNTENFTTNAIPDTQNPTTPINLVASNITQTTVDLTWTAATDNVAVTNYRIYNNGLILGSEIGNVSNYTVTGLTPGTLYNLTIRAIDAANNESIDSNAQDFTTEIPDTENPTAPLNLVASNVGNTTVDLTWTAATDNVEVTDYIVYNNGEVLINSTGIATSYRIIGLSADTTYNLTLRAIDEANNQSIDSNNQEFKTIPFSLTDNMPQEIAYFDAYYLPSNQASSLQNALDTYGAVRLGPGNYSASGDIIMKTNQRLYGWLTDSGTRIGGSIRIVAGSNNIHLEGISTSNDIIFESGSPITNCTLQSIYYCNIKCTNAQLENNTFVDMARVKMNFNCSSGGYLRNNTFIKCFAQSVDDHLLLIGNETTPSYGNIELSRNLLTSPQNTTEYNTLQSHTLLGSDAEAWGQTGQASANAAFYFRNIGRLNIDNIMGYGSFGSPEFDIEADELIMTRRAIGSATTPIVRTGTEMLYVYGSWIKLALETGVWSIISHNKDNRTIINASDFSSNLSESDAYKLQNLILGPQYTPWSKPILPNIPNPTGVNWASNRIGQTDSSNLIQVLINDNGIAELDEGIYYISKSLILTNGQGIVGKGTGKTAIVGITDDFPLVLAQDNVTTTGKTSVSYTLAYLTLQGGSVGLHIDPVGKEVNQLQLTNNPWKNIVLRNQNYGIHLDKFYGMDNTFFDNMNFVSCNIGFFQDVAPQQGTGEYTQNMYVDKTVFYQSQYINCGIAFDMQAVRSDNLDAWINCSFDSNKVAINQSNSNGIYIANSIFKNHTGNAVLTGNAPNSLYSCEFTNNNVTALFDKIIMFAEGCNFKDAVPLFSGTGNKEIYLSNNNITSTLISSQVSKGILINNNFTNNTTFNKLMVEIKNGLSTSILNIPSITYPQLLVKQ